MSANIDKSLGDIISSRKTSTRGRRTRKGAARAPVGGIAKNVAKTKVPPKAAAAAAAAAAAPAAAHKKIIVSNMPSDITVKHLKEYFGTKVGPISKVELSYGPNGVSRGVATIIFRENLAQKAVAEHNGVKIDDSHFMKVEVVYDARSLPTVEAPKSLLNRVTTTTGDKKKDRSKKEQQQQQPKKAKAEERGATAASKGGHAGAKRGRNAGRPRPKKKTADELDAEMKDYFDNKANGNGAAQAAAPAAAPAGGAGGETMDEVL